MREHAAQHGIARPRAAGPLAGAGSLVAGYRAAAVGALLLATLVAVSALNPAFLSVQNVRDLLVQAAPVVIVGCGMTLVILAGEIDISVGSLFGLLAALLGVLSSGSHLGLSAPVATVIVLGAGTLVGSLNGFLVTVARVPSIIATLGMLTVLRGVTELVMGEEWITDLPAGIRVLGTGGALGIPWCLWAASLVTAWTLVIARRTRLGLRIYAVGGNEEAAALAGISCRRTRMFAFTFTGFLTGVATLVAVPQLSVIEPGLGTGLELTVITAVLVGGTSISGGLGGIAGTVVAALLLGSVRTALVFLDIGEMATYWERAIQGAFILAAVLSDHLASASRPAPKHERNAP